MHAHLQRWVQNFPEPVVFEVAEEARGAVIMLHGLTSSGEAHAGQTERLRAAVPGMRWIYPTAPTVRCPLCYHR